MLSIFSRLIIALSINFILVLGAYSQINIVQKKKIDFSIKTEQLLNGDIHYFFSVLTPRKLAMRFPKIYRLDSLSLTQESGVFIAISKYVQIVKKPVGFFEQNQLIDQEFLKHMMGQQEIKKLSNDSFKVFVGGKQDINYKIQYYFDSDNISTLPNSKVIRAVSSARELDVISKSASTVMFTEKSQFNKLSPGAVSVSSFIPIKENSTMIITYNLWAIEKSSANKSQLKSNLIEEMEGSRILLDNFH